MLQNLKIVASNLTFTIFLDSMCLDLLENLQITDFLSCIYIGSNSCDTGWTSNMPAFIHLNYMVMDGISSFISASTLFFAVFLRSQEETRKLYLWQDQQVILYLLKMLLVCIHNLFTG